MKPSKLNGDRLRIGRSIGFSWSVVVFLGALMVTVGSTVGKEIRVLEGEKSEFDSSKENNYWNFLVQQGQRYQYESHNRREPFLPLVTSQEGRLNRSSSGEESRAHRSTWKLLGILSGREGIYASIQNTEGKRYVVSPGSVIPSEGLLVKRINKTDVEFDYLDKTKVKGDLEGSQKLIVSF